MPDIPRAIPEKNGYYNVVVPYFLVVANQTRWGITNAKPLALNEEFGANWEPNYLSWSNDSVKNHLTIVNIDDFAVSMDDKIRSICEDIPYSKLSSADKLTLLIADKPTSYGKIHAQLEGPKMDVKKQVHGLTEMYLQNPLTPDSTAMPKGNMAVVLSYKGLAGLLDKDIAWGFDGIAAGNIYKIAHLPADDGKTLYTKSLYFHGVELGNCGVMCSSIMI